MPFEMSRFVFWSGVYNAGLAVFLLFPPAYRTLGLNVPAPLWGWLVGGFLGFTSAVLILASRDLRRRASLVYMFGLPKELNVSHQALLLDLYAARKENTL